MSKPSFLLIPALGCDGGLYGMLAPAIAGHADPITRVPDDDTLPGCVAQILAHAPDKFFIGGTSFGGHVAREVAFAAPERVLGLMVIGAGAGAAADPEGGRRRSARLRAGEQEAVMREMAANITSPAAPHGKQAREDFLRMALAADAEQIARQNDALVVRPDRWNDLARLKMPSLLLWGRDDRFSPAMDGLRMAGLIANSRFVELEDVGHLPSLEAPHETADAVRHWLMDSGF